MLHQRSVAVIEMNEINTRAFQRNPILNRDGWYEANWKDKKYITIYIRNVSDTSKEHLKEILKLSRVDYYDSSYNVNDVTVLYSPPHFTGVK